MFSVVYWDYFVSPKLFPEDRESQQLPDNASVTEYPTIPEIS